MKQTLDQFISVNTGKTIDTDGAYDGQCMDLMHKYLQDVFGYPLSHLAAGAAMNVYLNFASMAGKDKFAQIANTPTAIPQKGDIVFWGAGVGPYGHVAVVVDADVNGFTSFDQNWNNVQKCELIKHNYNYVLGWLHPKANDTNSPQPPMTTDRRPYWFDRMNTVTFNKPQESVTDADVEQFVKDYPGQKKRSGEFDKLARELGFSGDTNTMTANMLLKVAEEKYKSYDEQKIRKDERQKTIAQIQRTIEQLNG